MQTLVICLDISESMAYGEPTKINQAINSAEKAVQALSRDTYTGLVTFDATAEVLLDPQPYDLDKIGEALLQITSRGISCIAAGLAEAVNLVKRHGSRGAVLLLTDGRANLSLNRMGGFEGSLDLENELLEIAQSASESSVSIHTVAVGEDAFTHTLSTMSENAKGHHWLAEDFHGVGGKPVQAMAPVERSNLQVHGAPAELPSAQPTWTKESQFMHVAVVSQRLYETYKATRRVFLVNPLNHREARTALISVESDVLAAYRQRRPKTARAVRAEEGLLLDKSYRGFLGLGRNDRTELAIY